MYHKNIAQFGHFFKYLHVCLSVCVCAYSKLTLNIKTNFFSTKQYIYANNAMRFLFAPINSNLRDT